MTIVRQRARRRRGATLVETAVVLSTFLLFVFGVFEYGRFVMTRHLLENAAREGARIAVVSTDSLTTADIEALVRAKLTGQVSTATIQVYKADPATGANLGSWNTAGYGECIAIEITHNYKPLFPPFSFPLIGNVTFLDDPTLVTARCLMRSEAN
jgi:Flp pilus assembly protein TadG